MENITGSIDLTKFKNVRTSMKRKDGSIVKGVFIPITENYLVEGEKGGVFANLNIILKDEKDQYGNNGFISHQVPSDMYKAASDEEKKAFDTKILGNIKKWEASVIENTDENIVDSTPEIDDDELPF